MRIISGVLIPVFGYLILGIILSYIPTHPEKINCENTKEIYVSTNGVHLDIVIPAEYLGNSFKEELSISTSVKYLSFGWGDKGFYLETPTWDKLKFSVAVKALFLKSETAMHVTEYKHALKKWNNVELCEQQYEKLIHYILNSFKRNNTGTLVEMADAGYTEHDRFYEAVGNYYFLNTCNDWVNKALKISEVKTSVWSPFDFGVLHHVK